ncbi:methylated-DNA--[protein]-cysteine S-methyltransferase [Achromobacter mucicolens]|uniref:methylated-DNA--[protein]-cysteine S-methyltransferase n=1 Tax=Achromobacter mucicolens TaxID=1389922 RepID=UPI0024487726|nr:methylated-DNA--[protein]-cysteine S-methyltransferase [Achromobacter mucicolens]
MPIHTFLLERVPTPIGQMLVLTDAQDRLRAVDWEDYESRMHLANGANRVGIVIPCHRVIGANAALTGYGGGLARKRWLLAHEAAWLRAQPSVEAVPVFSTPG